jgi:hypothetical protein
VPTGDTAGGEVPKAEVIVAAETAGVQSLSADDKGSTRPNGVEDAAKPVASKESVATENPTITAADEDEEPVPDPAEFFEPHILAKADAAFVKWFVETSIKNPPPTGLTIADIRASPEKFRSILAMDSSEEPRVSDHEVISADGEKITARLYLPDPDKFGPGPYPFHMNYHGETFSDLLRSLRHRLMKAGGGFVLGDLWGEAQICLSMRESGVAVIDLIYRHCPGEKFTGLG